MIMYSRELTVNWGESDPFGLVYFPLMLAWFNDTEHELLRVIGYATDKLIKQNRTAFVMGDVHFRFIGPAAYGDKIRTTIQLSKMTKSTLHWDCKAVQMRDGATSVKAARSASTPRSRMTATSKAARSPKRSARRCPSRARWSRWSRRNEAVVSVLCRL